MLAVGGGRDREDEAVGRAEGGEFTPVLEVPDFHEPVGASREEEAVVGTELERVDIAVVPLEEPERLAGLGVPEPNSTVIAAGGERAIG